MANTKKTKVFNEVEVCSEQNTVADENAILKAKIAEQERQMADMLAQMKVMMQAQAATNMVAEQDEKSARGIKFISLIPGGLNLKGNRMYHIDKQFGYKMIPETEARLIVSNMPNTIASGMVYIADKEFVHKVDLDGVYEEILSDKQLKDLLAHDSRDVCEIFKSAGAVQKQIIIDMVANRKMKGIAIDANIVVELGHLCGKDLMSIEPEEEK